MRRQQEYEHLILLLLTLSVGIVIGMYFVGHKAEAEPLIAPIMGGYTILRLIGGWITN